MLGVLAVIATRTAAPRSVFEARERLRMTAMMKADRGFFRTGRPRPQALSLVRGRRQREIRFGGSLEDATRRRGRRFSTYRAEARFRADPAREACRRRCRATPSTSGSVIAEISRRHRRRSRCGEYLSCLAKQKDTVAFVTGSTPQGTRSARQVTQAFRLKLLRAAWRSATRCLLQGRALLGAMTRANGTEAQIQLESAVEADVQHATPPLSASLNCW